MLRHRKKHSNKSSSFVSTSGENSPNSDDEEPGSPAPYVQALPKIGDKKLVEPILSPHKSTKGDLRYDSNDANEINCNFYSSTENERKLDIDVKLSNIKPNSSKEDGVDLIAKLLDIDDKSLVDEMLTSKSADDVAKLLGVKK